MSINIYFLSNGMSVIGDGRDQREVGVDLITFTDAYEIFNSPVGDRMQVTLFPAFSLLGVLEEQRHFSIPASTVLLTRQPSPKMLEHYQTITKKEFQ